jgi:glycosyltransferase involved in cell wall biosynthesis
LPADKVVLSWTALWLNFLARLKRVLFVVRLREAALGRKAGVVAAAKDRPILAYSYYASYAFERASVGRRKIIFQVHPHPQTVREILLEELHRMPEAAQSLSGEYELAFPPAALKRLHEECRMADFALTPSSFARDTLVRYGVPRERIAVVPYGIDVKAFVPKTFTDDNPQRPLRFIFVGSLIQRKGLSYLFETARRFKGLPVEFVAAGRGMRDEALIAANADTPIRIVWNAPRDQLVGEIQNSDVFIFPSLVESFAHVILEAMAVGLPVITTVNTAGPDLLEDGKTGFVGPIRDVDFLAQKVQWFLDNRAVIPVMGRRCQQVAAHYSWPRFRENVRAAVSRFEQMP